MKCWICWEALHFMGCKSLESWRWGEDVSLRMRLGRLYKRRLAELVLLSRLYNFLTIACSESHAIKLIGFLVLHDIHNFYEITSDSIFDFTCKLTFFNTNFWRRAHGKWIVILGSISIILLLEILIGLGIWSIYNRVFVLIFDVAISCVGLASRYCYISFLVILTLLQCDGKKLLYGLLLMASCRSDTAVITVIQYRLGYLGLAREVSLFFVFLVLSHQISQLNIAMVAHLSRIG